MKNIFLMLMLFAACSFYACKKDKLIVNEEKVYAEVNHTPMDAYDGGWGLILKPDGVAEVLPGGDIAYRGTYKISGAKIKVKTEQNNETYQFDIVSETEIKVKGTEVLMRLAGK